MNGLQINSDEIAPIGAQSVIEKSNFGAYAADTTAGNHRMLTKPWRGVSTKQKTKEKVQTRVRGVCTSLSNYLFFIDYPPNPSLDFIRAPNPTDAKIID